MTSEADVGPGSTASARPQSRPPRGSGGPSDRAKLIIAILIATTSLVGTFVAWRAVSVARAASSAREQALQHQAAAAETAVHADGLADLAKIDYDLRLRADEAQAASLKHAAERARGRVTQRQLNADAVAFARSSAAVLRHVDDNAIGPGGQLQLTRDAQVYTLADEALTDTDPRPQQKEAARLQANAEDLKADGLAALVAAFFLTLAQVSRTRAWRLYFTGGVLVLIGTAAYVSFIGIG